MERAEFGYLIGVAGIASAGVGIHFISMPTPAEAVPATPIKYPNSAVYM